MTWDSVLHKLSYLVESCKHVSELFTDKKKDDLVVNETRGNRQMISQILNSTFNCHGAVDRRITCPLGPEVIIAKIVNFKKVVFSSDINISIK